MKAEAEKRAKEEAEQKKRANEARKKQEEKRLTFVRIEQPEVMKLTKEKRLDADLATVHKGEYTWMFWINLQDPIPGWSNVFHKGQSNMERNPAVFVYPYGRRLHIRTGTKHNWNAGSDPENQLPKDWMHVAFTHDRAGNVQVMYNGEVVSAANVGGPAVANSGPLFASDPWYNPANAAIADLRMYPLALSQREVFNVLQTSTKRPKE